MYAQDQKDVGKGGTPSPVESACEFRGARRMGARVFFSFIASDAEKVYLVGSFNDWSETHPMQNEGGVWQISIGADEIHDGGSYKFKVYLLGTPIYVSDPYSPETDGEPYFNSIYRESVLETAFGLQSECHAIPVSIYAVEADAWAYGSDGNPLPYEMLANELLPYLLQMGYTHVSLSRIFDPLSLSPKNEQGGTDGLRKLIRRIHSCRIGVLITVPETKENAHTTAEKLAYWLDTLGPDGVLIDLPYQRELEFYYELYSSVKRIKPDAKIVSNLDEQKSIPSDLSIRECAEMKENDSGFTPAIAADATEILLGEGKMLTRAGCELGLSERSAAVDWKRTDCADCARLQLYLSELNRVYLSNHMIWCGDHQTKTSFSEENGIRTVKRESGGKIFTVIRNIRNSDAIISLDPDQNHEMLIATNCDMNKTTVNLAGGAVCAIASEKNKCLIMGKSHFDNKSI